MDYQTIQKLVDGYSENEITFKSECTFYPVNWIWKLIEIEKKDPLLASIKIFESSNDNKIGK